MQTNLSKKYQQKARKIHTSMSTRGMRLSTSPLRSSNVAQANPVENKIGMYFKTNELH